MRGGILLFLLLTPYLHNDLVGQKLCQEHLTADRCAADRNVLAAEHVVYSSANDLSGGEKFIVIFDGIVLNGSVKKFGAYPTGADGDHLDALLFQLLVESAGEGQHKCLGCAIGRNIGYGNAEREPN